MFKKGDLVVLKNDPRPMRIIHQQTEADYYNGADRWVLQAADGTTYPNILSEQIETANR